MNNKDFFEFVVNHFLVISQSNHNKYNITDYKLNIYGTNFEIRDSDSKIFLDNINLLSDPLVTGFVKNDESMLLPPTRNWKSLTLKIDDELYSLHTGLKLLFSQNKLPVVLLEELQVALGRPDKMEIRVHTCELDDYHKKSKEDLFNFARNKASMLNSLDFYKKVLDNFVVVKTDVNVFNFSTYSLDENFSLVSNPKYEDKFKNINLSKLHFEFEETNILVSPPLKNWKNSLTISSGNYINSIIQGIPTLFQKSVPVILYDDLVKCVEGEKFEIPVHLFSGENLGYDNFNNLKAFVIEYVGLSMKTFGEVLAPNKTGTFKVDIVKEEDKKVESKKPFWMPKIFWR